MQRYSVFRCIFLWWYGKLIISISSCEYVFKSWVRVGSYLYAGAVQGAYDGTRRQTTLAPNPITGNKMLRGGTGRHWASPRPLSPTSSQCMLHLALAPHRVLWLEFMWALPTLRYLLKKIRGIGFVWRCKEFNRSINYTSVVSVVIWSFEVKVKTIWKVPYYLYLDRSYQLIVSSKYVFESRLSFVDSQSIIICFDTRSFWSIHCLLQ